MSGTRLDVNVLYGLLNAKRMGRGVSWSALAGELDVTPNVFSRMSHGTAPDAHTLLALLLWLGWAPELSLLVKPKELSS